MPGAGGELERFAVAVLGVNDATAVISALPAKAAPMLAVEILLAEPGALAGDVLESCFYMLRERLRIE